MALFDKKKFGKIREKEEKAKKQTIMIVDDEENQLNALWNLLSEEYNIITARDGQEALDIINAMKHPESIGVVIADQRMPRLTGINLFEKLKDILPSTLRIIITAYADKNVILNSISDAKVYEFILKPVDSDELKLKVKRALENFELQKELDEYIRKLEEFIQEIVQKNKELKELSLTDPLTGLRNLRYLNEFIDQAIAIVQEDYEGLYRNSSKQVCPRKDFIFLIIEIDEFKILRETYHRAELDMLLKQFSDILKSFFNDSDIIVRRGDAEFLIVNHTDREKAKPRAKGLLRLVEDHIFHIGTDKEIDLTCSIGSACYPFIPNHHDAIDWRNTINIAEIALQTAKNSGGNTWGGLFGTDRTKPASLLQKIMEEIEILLENDEVEVQSSLPAEKLVWRKIKIKDPKIKKRWTILNTLDNLVFNTHTREAKIHKIFADNLWILGPEYSIMSSNETLKKVVEERLCQKYQGDDAKKRPDLFLAQDVTKRYLLIEFKRPKHVLDRNDESQAQIYRDELNEYDPNAKIEIMLIGGRVKKNISSHYLRDDVKYFSYQSVISNARTNLKNFIEDLRRGH